jgi:hypothetical protein
MSGAKDSKKHRKVGRNALYCKAYANTNRREKNKIKKLKKHLAKFANDACAAAAVASCKVIIGIK